MADISSLLAAKTLVQNTFAQLPRGFRRLHILSHTTTPCVFLAHIATMSIRTLTRESSIFSAQIMGVKIWI
jgi:hypothetical protein